MKRKANCASSVQSSLIIPADHFKSDVCTQIGKTLTRTSWLIKAISENLIPLQRSVNYLHLFLNTASQHQLLRVVVWSWCRTQVPQGRANVGVEDPTARGVKNEKAVIHRGGRPCEGGLTNVFRFRDTSERLMRVTAGRGTVRGLVPNVRVYMNSLFTVPKSVRQENTDSCWPVLWIQTY